MDLAGGKLRLDHPAEHVARLTIDNPAKRNALDHEILDAFATTLPRLDARCLLVTGTGTVFSAGYDLGGAPRSTQPFQAALDALDAFPFPAVAALNGHAIGGGLELALACDLRVASGAARLGMPPARLGVIYSHSGLRRFVEAIGAPRTRELFFTAADVSAETALAWGLVNEIADADRALELAAGIAANAPLSLAGNKRVLAELRPALDPEVERELAALHEASLRSEDFAEGVRAFAEKRAPRWRGR